jgi:hypothetical protein
VELILALVAAVLAFWGFLCANAKEYKWSTIFLAAVSVCLGIILLLRG